MRIISDDARRHLFDRQQVCEVFALSYVDAIWKTRYQDVPVSKGAWPYKSAAEAESNVLPIKRGKK